MSKEKKYLIRIKNMDLKMKKNSEKLKYKA